MIDIHSNTRLQDKVESDWHRVRGHRAAREKIWKAYIGDTYGLSPPNSDRIPLNGHALYARSLILFLAAHQPKPLITTDVGPWKRHTESLETQVARVMREQRFGFKQQRWVLDALLYSPGILKVAQEWRVVPTEDGEETTAVLQTYMSNVDASDWVYDTAASSVYDCAYTAHRIRLPVEDIVDNPMFDHLDVETIRSAAGGDEHQDERLFFEDTDRSQPLRHVVTCWEAWDKRDNKIKIWPVNDTSAKWWYKETWDGHDNGPLHYIDYLDVPNHVVGLSPLSLIHNLVEATNRALSKTIQQTDYAKSIMRIMGGNEAEAKAVMEAVDGQGVYNSSNVAEMLQVPGPDQRTLAMVPILKDLFNWQGGNINELAGLGVSAPTATQGRLLSEAASGMVKFMQSRTQEAVRVAVEAMGHNELRDQVNTEVVPVPLADGTTFWKQFTPEDRQAINSILMEFNIDVSSMRYRSPEDHLQQLMQWWQGFAIPAMGTGIVQQQGVQFDFQTLNRHYAKLTDQPVINEVTMYVSSQEPEATGSPVPEPGRQSPVTSRTNIRQDSGGGQEAGLGGSLAESLVRGAA